MAVNRDKRDGATCCDNEDNHPYPVIADIVIVFAFVFAAME
jgi:hypothetical protein